MRKVVFLWALALLLFPVTSAFANSAGDLDSEASQTEERAVDSRAYLGIDDLPFPGEGDSAGCDPTLNPCEDGCCWELYFCLSGCPGCQYSCMTQFRNCEMSCHGGGGGWKN